MKKINDTTLEITFAVPYPVLGDQLGRDYFSTDRSFFYPSKWLKKWHKKYNDQADEVAKAENKTDWIAAFSSHANPAARGEVGRPMIGPWYTDQMGTDRMGWVRNPYFHHVDPDGNQLPYVDNLDIVMVASKEVSTLKASSGEYDFESFFLDLKDMPVFRQNEEKGGYTTLLPLGLQTTQCYISFNQTAKDEVLKELFRKKDFRIAMSLGIDRKAINDALFFGLGTPFPAIAHRGMSFFRPEWATMYIQYDTAKANSMLDSVGLTKKDGDGYRLRSDGQRLSLLVEVGSQEGAKIQTCEMVKEQWRQLGVELIIKPEETSILDQRTAANDIICGTHHTDRCALFGRPQPNHFGYDNANANRWGPAWVIWFNSDGKQGEEPPQQIKDHKALMDQWRQTLPGSPEFDKIGGEYWAFFAEEIPMLGTVGYIPQPMVVSKKLHNLPDKDLTWTSDVNFVNPYNPTTWFFE
jgi:peptide/nickel transport system substrate-binding protein